jgi:hypothetical protein
MRSIGTAKRCLEGVWRGVGYRANRASAEPAASTTATASRPACDEEQEPDRDHDEHGETEQPSHA